MADKPTPQYLQLTALLSFLYASLQADTILRSLMCTDPDVPDPNDIVRKTLEHDPFEVIDGPDGAQLSLIYEQEIPVLACWESKADPIASNRAEGDLCHLSLMYLFRNHVGNADVTPKAWAARLSKMVSWRIRAYLNEHYLTGWGTTGDLYLDGFIHDIEPGSVTRLTARAYEGFGMDLLMLHTEAPYTVVDDDSWRTTVIEVHEDDEIPAVDGVIVEADI